MKPLTDEKLIIYQVLPRILTNDNDTCTPWGTYEQNGSGKLNDFTPQLLESIRGLGVNTLWLTGVIEHATQTAFPGIPADNGNVVKGQAGSPYAIKDYFDIAPSLATDVEHRMEEFEALVQRVHDAGMRLIIDFVPNHTARVYKSDSAPRGVEDFGASDDITRFFSPNNNYYYLTNQQLAPGFDISRPLPTPYLEYPAKATGNDAFTPFPGETDWYETVKLNYGHDYGDNSDHFDPIPDTWLKMLRILRFWAAKGVDGFRCDMVYMVPLPFWHWVTREVRKDYPDTIFIGEIYDVTLYRDFISYGGFDYLYDKVNLYDILHGIEQKHFSAARITSAWQTVDGISDHMLNFLENHDEVRFASPEYGSDPQRVVPHLVVSAMISRGPFLLYYGQELGEKGAENEGFAGYNNRTTIFDYWSCDAMRRWNHGGRWDTDLLSTHEKWLRHTYSRLLHLCQRPEIVHGDFFDLMYANQRNPEFNPHRQFAFVRRYRDQLLLIVANFDDRSVSLGVNMPEDLFRTLDLAPGRYTATDLYDHTLHTLDLTPLEPARLSVDRNNALILSLSTRDKENINPNSI